MKTKKFAAMLITIFSLNGMAQDGVGPYVEPTLFYETGTSQFSSDSGIINFDGKLEGFGVGVKGGLHVWEIGFAGLDFMYSQPKFTESQGRFSSNTKSWLLGVLAGAQMPVAGLRVWAGYSPLGNMDQDRDRGLQMKFSNPSIFKLGAGIHVSMVSINLEYLWGSYGKSDITNDNSTYATFANASAKRNTFLLGVSFPINL